MAASNYDLNMMAAGMVFVFIACAVSLVGLVPILESSSPPNLTLLSVALSYALMMFASSYVEEEHNFWYWIASGWFFALFLKGYGPLYTWTHAEGFTEEKTDDEPAPIQYTR